MVIATGFFDGVHLGHRRVISTLVSEARARGEESMVVTFWPHPRNVLQKDARSLRLLSSQEEKKRMLLELGVDHVEVVDFTREFSALSAERYLREYIIGKFGGTAVLLGYDNRLGGDGLSPEEIARTAGGLGLDVIRTPEVSGDSGFAVSSSKIRIALEKGEVGEASAMLGYDYPLLGVVVAGKRLGRAIGFPTANMELYEPLKLVPANGAYLVRVHTLGRELYGMCNIGVRPTISDGNARTIETNIFSFDEDIYGLDLGIEFISKIRDEVRFPDLDSLKARLALDRDTCLARLSRP
ncbi:MAG: riboflavin biosynthesis protein RibF [Bacteroidales bacterium]|nr:riboflavin biosynthesis protein RibF [Bacteroidales bacterium]